MAAGSKQSTGRRARPYPLPTARLSRRSRGVTLLEVLISIGVVAVGLLGVVALIPVGSLAVNETVKADRSAAMGRAAMHEVRVRNMLENSSSTRWLLAQDDLPMNDSNQQCLQTRQQFLIGQAFAIDPLFATEVQVQAPPAVNYRCFPFKTAGSFEYDHAELVRLNLYIFVSGILIHEQWLTVFNRIFSWPDDLIFDIDYDDPDRRPRQSFYWDNGTVAASPLRDDDPDYAVLSSQNELVAQAAGDYTWMFTVEPDASELPDPEPYPSPALPPNDPSNMPTLLRNVEHLNRHEQKTFTVSVVTFYRRDFSCDATAAVPSERLAKIEFTGTGIGGGDARLMVPSNPPDATGKTREEAEEYLKVKEDEWIMVSGFVREPRLDPVFWDIISQVNHGVRRIARWYRVIRVDDEVELDTTGTYYFRNVTLAGPDWYDASNWQDPILFYNNSGNQYDSWPNQPRATIIDGAIGVYTTTVTLE